MEKVRLKGVARGVLWMVLWAVIGYLLLVLAYCLPVDRMQKHLESSLDAFQDGPTTLLKDDTAMWIDYLTDSMILAEAVYDGEESAWNQAAAVYSNNTPADGEGSWTYRKMQAALENDQSGPGYPRYWHGNLVYLKPLLFVFDYKDILTLNMLLQLALMFWIVSLLGKQNGGDGLLLPMAVAFGMLTPPAMVLCLQYMPCFYVMAAACIVLLRWPEVTDRHPALFFLTVGMATSYFDFLTFPLVTLGVPLVLYLLKHDFPCRKGLCATVYTSICWGTGYLGFWAMKWLIGSFVLQENLFADALNSFLLRSSHETEGQTIGYLDALEQNLGVYYDLRIWKVLFALAAAVLLLRVLWMFHKKISIKPRLNVIVPLLLVACMPFAWYFVTVNHSYIHYGYTHKELMISGLALTAVVAVLFRKQEQET